MDKVIFKRGRSKDENVLGPVLLPCAVRVLTFSGWIVPQCF